MTTLDLRRILSGPSWTFGLIVLLNLIPVGGVLWLGWSAGQILMLYWVENIIVGALSLCRILTAQGRLSVNGDVKQDRPLPTGCFFIVHYGLFTLVHGVFALVLAGRMLGDAGLLWREVFADPTFHWAVLAAAALQMGSMIRDWWLSGLWRRSSPFMEMFRPYGRVAVLHVTVLGGAWALDAMQAPVGAVLLLCLAKAALELGLVALARPGGD